MVERLKQAIEKARAQRGQATGTTAAPAAAMRPGVSPPVRRPEAWSALSAIDVDLDRLEAQRVVTPRKTSQAAVSFDLLRTRLLKLCRDNGWTRIGITSPTKGCGKSFVCLNLAFSLARNPDIRAALIDLDLLNPCIARRLGVKANGEMRALLEGGSTPAKAMQRCGDNLALGMLDRPLRNSAEVIQSQSAATALAAVNEALAPDITIYDLPPMFVGDDVLAFAPNIDGIILVAAVGETKADEIEECERLIGNSANFIGVVLNKVADGDSEHYYEGYAKVEDGEAVAT